MYINLSSLPYHWSLDVLPVIQRSSDSSGPSIGQILLVGRHDLLFMADQTVGQVADNVGSLLSRQRAQLTTSKSKINQ